MIVNLIDLIRRFFLQIYKYSVLLMSKVSTLIISQINNIFKKYSDTSIFIFHCSSYRVLRTFVTSLPLEL